MEFTRLSKFSFAVLILVSTLGSIACTKKDESGSIRLSMPASVNQTTGKTDVTASASGGGGEWNTSLNPTAGPQLNCFAVFVSGSGLDNSQCIVSDSGTSRVLKFGAFAGLLAQGSQTTIEVTSGSDRVVHVVGFRAATVSDCTKNILPAETDNSVLSEPFFIASKEIVVAPSAVTAVEIQPVLNLSRKVLDCKLAGATNGGGSGGGGGGTGSGVISWGDKRDGSLTMQGISPRTVTIGANTFGATTDLVHSPNSGGVASTKTFGASRQITNIDTATGTTLTLATSFTANEFQAGDEVLWYVSAGNAATSPDDPDVGACGSTFYRGRYGTATIASTAPAIYGITLNKKIADEPAKIKNANLIAPINATNFCRISLHRIPNFDQISVPSGAFWTITPAPYVPSTGTDGVVVLRTQKLEVDGNFQINATNKGYFGGAPNYPGGSITGPGILNSPFANSSGGGASSGVSAAGGAGAGQGGFMSTLAFGGTPLNYCEHSVYTTVSSGTNYNCGLADEGDLKCWGLGVYGQFGDGYRSNRSIPSIAAPGIKFSKVSTGATHTCGIQKTTGKLFCWGYNAFGQLGDGTTTDHFVPMIVDAASNYKSVALAQFSTCAIKDDGSMRCWGYGGNGQLGNGALMNQSSPVSVDIGVNYASVSAGQNHVCGITALGELKCWGDNTYGKLGDGTTTTRTTPVSVGTNYLQVSAGKANSTCAVTTLGVAKCWGENTAGQVGDGTTTDRFVPTSVTGGLTFLSVDVGLQHTCGVTADQRLRCWGGNTSGTIGDGTFTQRTSPTLIDASTSYKSVSSSVNNSCAVTMDGFVKCWGQDTYGQIGRISVGTNALEPTKTVSQRTCLPFASQKAYFGGGGGGSSTSHTGASGGGLVLVFAKEITGSGSLTIVSNGGDGLGTPASVASGGGGGGTVAIATRAWKINGANIFADGGQGFNTGAPSGGGGGGTVDLKHCGSESVASAVASIAAESKGGIGFTGSDPGALGVVERTDSATTCTTN